MKIHLPPEAAMRSTSSSSRKKVGADLRDPVHLRVGGDDVAQQRFGALDVDGEIVVDEEDGDLAAFAFRAGLQQQQFVDDAFVGAKADGVAKESGDGAEFAAVGTAAPGLDGNDAKGAPAVADYAGACASTHFGTKIELIEVDLVPRDCGIVLEAGLALLAEVVDRRVDLFELAARGVFDDLAARFRRLRRERRRRRGAGRRRGRALRRLLR